MEIEKSGMLRASFAEDGKLQDLDMMFDAVAVHQQLQRATGVSREILPAGYLLTYEYRQRGGALTFLCTRHFFCFCFKKEAHVSELVITHHLSLSLSLCCVYPYGSCEVYDVPASKHPLPPHPRRPCSCQPLSAYLSRHRIKTYMYIFLFLTLVRRHSRVTHAHPPEKLTLYNKSKKAKKRG